MALITSTITGRLPLPDNTVAEGGYVQFTLTGVDADGNDVALSEPVIAAMTATGNISVELWPNVLGEQRTQYAVSAFVPGPSGAWREIEFGRIVVQNEDASIADLLPIRLPANFSSDVQIHQGETIDMTMQVVDDYARRIVPLDGLTAASFIKRAGAAQVDLTATIVDDVVQISHSAANTASLPLGQYYWQVSLAEAAKTVIWSGTITIKGAP